jgi:Bifunctional DNA primase/polymerase, N-terminal
MPWAAADLDEAQAVLESIYERLGRQAVLLPIPLRTKAPAFRGWQKTTLAPTLDVPYWFELINAAVRGGNLGVLLGPPSGGLVTVDIDDQALVDPFLERNPFLSLIDSSLG